MCEAMPQLRELLSSLQGIAMTPETSPVATDGSAKVASPGLPDNMTANTPVRLENVKLSGDGPKAYRHAFLTDVRGKGGVYEGIDFSYSVFTRAYFHNAVFRGCKFIGCRFADCNFRNASFSQCDFSYSDFSGTRIDADEILNSLPPQPNIRRELLQILRKNAISLGDVTSSRRFVIAEIDAKREHLRRAWRQDEGYYRDKYRGFGKRLGIGAKRMAFWVDSFLWGHGERLWKIAISVPVLLAIAAVVSTFQSVIVKPDPTVSSVANELLFYFRYYLALFLDIPYSHPDGRSLWMDAGIALLRYLAFGVLVAGLFRWLSHR